MAYRALDVAEFIVKRCNEKKRNISNLKLQKILYFVQAEFLVNEHGPCFDENIEAWDFGPVVPEVYRHYRIYGSTSIPYIPDDYVFPFSKDDRLLIDEIVDACAIYSASALVEITHRQDPWKKAYRSSYRAVISNESIKQYFLEE